jgi:hypothetical protein
MGLHLRNNFVEAGTGGPSWELIHLLFSCRRWRLSGSPRFFGIYHPPLEQPTLRVCAVGQRCDVIQDWESVRPRLGSLTPRRHRPIPQRLQVGARALGEARRHSATFCMPRKFFEMRL